jgi:hypothetical protein
MSKEKEWLLTEDIEIVTPKDFFKVVHELKRLVSNGDLLEAGGTCSLSAIQEGKPWPDDLINIKFITTPGNKKYILSCETFHGMGGIFKQISD